MQIPPMVSALKRNGKRLYELAREGIEVEREARPVTVYGLDMIGNLHDDGEGKWKLNIECSGGFYVRSLIEDMARAVDGAAHMTSLIRTKQGPFVLDDCLPPTPDQWTYESICEGIIQGNSIAGLTDLRPAFQLDN